MSFPITFLNGDGREVGLVVALAIGFLFGFVLERAGFGRATKLAAQFYLRDMTVFKVMFTAIITAMLGLVIASGFGLVDLRGVSEQIASWTFIWPMLAGGFILGVGFIISGYCPGTSAVSAASGNVDGVVTFGGVVAGTFLYSELMQIPAVARFHESGERGAWFLYDLLGIRPELLAIGITLAALAAFAGAEKVERIFSKDQTPRRVRAPRRIAFATLAGLAVVALGAAGMPAAAVVEEPPEAVVAGALARAVIDEPWSLRIIDVRDAAGFDAARIPGSENAPLATLDALGLGWAEAERTLVVVGDASLKQLPEGARAYRGRVVILEGGFEAWKEYALTPPPSPGAHAGDGAMEEYLFRSALHAALTGARQTAAPVMPPAAYVPKAKKKGGGCSS